jgi:hypothetical protein
MTLTKLLEMLEKNDNKLADMMKKSKITSDTEANLVIAQTMSLVMD